MTVCFGEVRVVVPCGGGQCRVRDLVDDAVEHYHKATPKVSEVRMSTSSVRARMGRQAVAQPKFLAVGKLFENVGLVGKYLSKMQKLELKNSIWRNFMVQLEF